MKNSTQLNSLAGNVVLLVTSSSFPATFPALMMMTLSLMITIPSAASSMPINVIERAGLAIVGRVTGNVLRAGQIVSEGCHMKRALNTLG